MNRMEILNYIIENRGYSSLLEIGVWGGRSNPAHNKIVCENKVGVDPDTKFSGDSVVPWTSDQYFEFLYSYTNGVNFDLIFIDGLHLEEQVDKDIENALNFLSDGGLIMLHDCSPLHEDRATEDFNPTAWNGTLYKSIVKLRCGNPDMYIETVDSDHGCAIIDPLGKQDVFSLVSQDNLLNDFSVFDKHRTEVLNLISVDEFEERYKNE